MTEIAAEYIVDTRGEQFGVEWVRCSQCSSVIGYEICGGAYLRVGKLKMKSMSAECGDCGHTIWWYSSDRHIKKITERRK